ncbi:hypothetical protein CKA32_002654 [Geitlerinema sp. FC II]|nr:hypothetical protein CKA32_002654 [Geitlerinema sp. FC II]
MKENAIAAEKRKFDSLTVLDREIPNSTSFKKRTNFRQNL